MAPKWHLDGAKKRGKYLAHSFLSVLCKSRMIGLGIRDGTGYHARQYDEFEALWAGEGQMTAKSGTQISEVARRYASAFFDLAVEQERCDELEAELLSLHSIITGSDELSALISHPVYGREEQLAALAALLEKAGASLPTQNLVKLLAKNGRLAFLPGVIRAFVQNCAAARGEIDAEAISAVALSDAQKAKLKAEIEKSAGQKINLETLIDPDILGGLVIKIGSQMIDSSLRTKLTRMKLAMKEA